MNIKKLLFAVITVLCLCVSSFSAINININSGNPTIPFPQFYNYTPSTLTYTVYALSDPEHTATGLALHQPDGVSLAEMEQWMRDAWKIHSNEFYYADTNQNTFTAVDVKTGPYQNATGGPANVRLIWEDSSPACSEGHGYALLGAALMCDKDTFDALWFYLNENGYFSNTKRYSTGAMFPAVSWGRHVPAWNTPLSAGTADSATDGDDDIAMAALLAWRQWGDNTGYYAPGGTGPLNTSNQPAIQYKQMALDMMRFMVEKYIDSNSKYLSGDIGYDGYHKSGNTWNETTNWYTGPDPLEKSGPQADGYFDYAAPGYFHSFGTVLQAQGDPAWNYNQFFRGEASDDWLMGQLGTNPLYKNITAGKFSVNGTTATFGEFNIGGEDFRAPMRTIINYLWHGNPTTSWDPVSHSIVAGGNQHELNAAIKQARFMSDPQTYGTGVGCEPYGVSPVTYRGLSSLQVYNLDGTLKDHNWHIVYELAGPGAAAAVAAQDFSLMGELFRDIMVQWDHAGGSDYYLNSIPHYFHGFFRQWGLMVLTGNMVDACHWDPKPNMRIFKAMDKTYSFPGETLKFWINYRNYGSVDATGVKIVDTLPAAFEYVSATDYNSSTHSQSGQVVTWNFPNPVSGLHNQNYNATMGGVTLTVRVKDNAVQGRYCNFADISCTNGTGSTSSPFPNDVSTIMCRTCVDIVSAALTITKAASTSTAQIGTTVTYTIDFCNSADAAGWINGGRSGVNFSFGLKTLPGANTKVLDFFLRGNHEAAEPAIDWANYRFSYFLNSSYSGSNWTIDYYNPAGFSSTPKLITTESFVACNPVPCSDGTGSWNQRVMLQFGNFGTSIAAPTHLLFWKATITAPNTYIHVGSQGYAFFLEGNITAGWTDQDWTNDWSQQEAWAVQTQDQALFPISPDWTRGDGTSTDVIKINKDACETVPLTNLITNILIEEWDGYTWRRVFGNGPMPGREVNNVHVIDSLPTYMSYGGVISAPAGSTLTAAGKSLDWNIGNMQINQCGQIKYWAKVLDPGCPGANGSVQTNIAFVKGDKEAPVSDSASVTILCGSPTNTPTTGASATFTRTSTFTPTYTSTNTPTFTGTYSMTNTSTNTPSSTFTMSSTNTFTATPTRTGTLEPTFTFTQTFTSTHTQTITNTFSYTASPTYTPSYTRTVSPSFTVTDTMSSNTPTYTQTSTDSFTATLTWTNTASPTCTFTNTQTPTPSATGSYTAISTYTGTATQSATPTNTISSDTPTHTPTWTNTSTATQTWTDTNTATYTKTNTDTPTYTGTPTQSGTSTGTATWTDTATYTATPTQSGTRTYTATFTATGTFTRTSTITATRTPTPTKTATRTVTQTATWTSTPMPSPVKLDISIETSGDNPAVGALITYTIKIKNNTTSPVTNIAVWDTLPSDMIFVSNNSEITPTQTGNYIYWNVANDADGTPFTLYPGQEMTIEFTAKLLTVDSARMPLTDVAMADYNDPYYTTAVGKHPAIYSETSFYPIGKPVVFPNPFNLDTNTVVTFDNIVPGSIIQIYTLTGEDVKTINTGTIKNTWDAKNRNGKKVSPGIYFFVIKNQTSGEVKTGKIFVVRGN